LRLGHPPLSALTQFAGKGQLDFDEGGFFWHQAQEFRRRADLPSLSF